MLICGAIFFTPACIIGAITLTRFEIIKIQKSRFLFSFSLTGICILFFIILGAKIFIELTLLWALGGILSFLFLYEVANIARVSLKH